MTPCQGYLRHPAIGGDHVIFVTEDDLWLVPAEGGHAFRLTATAGAASHPRLSPDGRQVAFTATQDGPSEVYVMPAEGGAARRLTFQAARCRVAGWAPGGREILYASAAQQPPGFGTRLFAVSAEGGLPRLLPYGPASAIAHGPGGHLVLGRNTADPARWKRYRGGTAGELWIGAATEGALFRRLVQLPGNLASPCWAGDRVCFISDHEGTGNVFSCRPDGSGLVRHTDHSDFYVRQLSSDGERLVYQAGARIYRLDPGAGGAGGAGGDGGPRALPIALRTSRAQHDRRLVPADAYLEDAALSHDGSAVAATIRGKLVTFGNWQGPVRQHGDPESVRYRLPSWLAGQDRLVAAAADERAEEYLTVIAPAADAPAAAREIPFPGGRPVELAASPVADLVAVATHRQQLHLVAVGDPPDGDPPGSDPPGGDPPGGDPPGGDPPAVGLVDQSPHGRIEDLAWSADGRYLAYTWPASPHCTVIKIADTRTGAVHQVTEPVVRDFAPCFDPGGRFLYFLGVQAATPVPDPLTAGLGFPQAVRPYVIALRDGSAPRDGSAAPFAPQPQEQEEEEDDGAAPPIEFAGIPSRIAPLQVAAGDYRRVLATSGKVLLLLFPPPPPLPGPDGDADPGPREDDGAPAGLVISFDLAARAPTELADGVTDMWLNQRRDALLCESGDRLRVLGAEPKPDKDPAAAPGEPGPASGWIDLDRVRVSISPQAEWRQMFREAWRLQREHFWDPGMSGIDWDAVYRRYLPLAGLVASRAELSDLLWEMHGELGTSHAYESGGEYRPGAGYRQGLLGVDWAEAGPGARIARIVPGDPRDPGATSPCARLGAGLRPGDTIVAVNGQPVGPAGPGELLIDQAGRDVELTVARPGAGPRPSLHRATVRPLADEGPARYRDWVAGNRGYVHEATGGRVGYVHVPDMLPAGYAEFIRGFLAEHDREALIVDVRFNGGGFCSWLVLERLARRRRGHESGRWSGSLPYPAQSPRGPMVALINEHTGSDGDIFSHVFRELRLGPLVGQRTWGGVIATYPRHALADGTVTTQPEFCYAFDGVGRRLENRGVEPDVDVDIAPHDHVLGLDTQLARAVEIALTEASRALDPPERASA